MPRLLRVLPRGIPAASTVPSLPSAPTTLPVPGRLHARWASFLLALITLSSLLMALTALGMLGGCERKDSTGSASSDASVRPSPAHSSDLPPAGKSGEPPTAMGNREAPRIVMFGDSLTAGFGLPLEMSMPSLLQRRLALAGYPHKVINAGVSGDTTAGGVSRLNWVLREPAAVMVLALGANDGLRGLDPALMRANLAKIIEETRRRKITVVLAGMKMPANYGQEYTTRFEAVFPLLAREYDLPFLPFLLDGVAMRPHLTQADGIHPNIAGTKAVAENVWKVLQPLLEK